MAAPGSGPILVHVGAAAADVPTIDVLARLQLTALRSGSRLELRAASRELRDLIAFVGLSDVLPVESEREAEEREDLLRVEEEGELDDSPA